MKKFIYSICLLLLTGANTLQAIDTPPAPPPLETPSQNPLFNDTITPPPSYEYAFFKMIISLIILLLLIFLTVWALKRLSSGRLKFMNQTLSIKVLEKRV